MESYFKKPMPMTPKKETKHLSTAPFDKICRTCLALEEQIFCIFEVTCKDINLSEFFANYIAVQVEQNDGLPQNVCGSCIAKFIEIYGFIQQCEQADIMLRTELNDRSKLTCQVNEKSKRCADDVGSSQCDILREAKNSPTYEDNEKVVPFLEETQMPSQKEIETEVINSQMDIDTPCREDSTFLFIDPDSKTDTKENISHVLEVLKRSDSDTETNEDLQNDDFLMDNSCVLQPTKGYHVIEPCAFQFSCKRCVKYFESLIKLKEHRKQEHSLPRNHVCVKCNKAISSYHNLQLHMKKCEKTDFPIQRDENLESKPSELLEKLLEANNFPFTVYSCRKCNKFYDSQDGLKMHRKQVKHSRTHNYVCPKCSKTVSSMYNLKEHMKTHTKEELSSFDLNLEIYACITPGDQNEQNDDYVSTKLEPDENNDFLSTKTTTAEDDQYEQKNHLSKLLKQLLQSDKSSNTFHGCKHCNLVFASYDEFIQHQKEMNHSKTRNFNHVCLICSKKCDRPSSLKQHMITHTKEKPFSCEVCQMRFSMKFNLRRHMMTHTDERPYVCEFCDKGFIQADCLAEHVRVKHTGEMPFECSYCDKHFARRMSYQTHLKTHRIKSEELVETSTNDETKKHSNYEILKCNVCQREFRSTACLKQHMALHEEKSFLCSHCGKSFALQNGLLSHMKIHTGAKPHSCTMCDKTFSHMESLKCHLRIHTGEKPFVCKICSKSFRQSAHLMYHMRMHNMEKSYKCSYCDKSFITNGNLTAHKRIHTGETLFVCNVCGKGFYHSNNLKKHKKVHEKFNEAVSLVTESSTDAPQEEQTN